MYVCEYTSPMDPSWVKYIMKKCVLVESQLANTNHQHIFEMNSFPSNFQHHNLGPEVQVLAAGHLNT